jgi:type IV pilus assembly protein PilQ
MVVVFLGYATATDSNVKKSPEPQEATAITGIDIQDNAVAITVNKPFIYTIYKPGDPYKIIIDLPNVAIGTFNQKIVSQKVGITEIVPSQLNSPFMARLEMLLHTPSMVEQEYKNNVLMVRIKEDRPKEVSEEKEDKPEQKPLSKATEITSISFEKSADIVKVLITGNGSMIPNVFPLDRRIVLDIPNVVLNTQLPSAVLSPVQGIRSGKHDDMIRLVLDLKEKTNFDVASIGDSIVIALQVPEQEPAISTVAQMPGEKTEAAIEVKEPRTLAKDKCKAYLEGKENINFDFQDQDIVPMFRLFADISGCNLFLHPDIKGRCTMKFIDVPWNQALDTILKTFSLSKAIEGNIIRIVPNKEMEKEAEAKKALGKAEETLATLERKTFRLAYAYAEDVKKKLLGYKLTLAEDAITKEKRTTYTFDDKLRVLSNRGNVVADAISNVVVVTDISTKMSEVEDFIREVDTPTRQVLIEARIVEVSANGVKDLGIQWGTFLKGTNTLTSLGGFSGLGTGSFTGGNYLVDFPGGAGVSSGSGFTFGILNPARTMGLDLQLNAVEEMGKGKIVSNPRILTLDNEEAEISQGASIPFRQQTAEGTVSEGFKDFSLNMKVTPRISSANTIAMSLDITKEEPDWTRVSALGTPSSKKGHAKTNIRIKDGETIVIGGIFKTTLTESKAGVPGLMNIPILGWLFKKERTSDETSELLIFITPRIVEKP